LHKIPTILFVSEKFPWPLDDGGQIRTFQILKMLASEFEVILIALAPSSPNDEIAVRDLGIQIVTFRRPKREWMIPWRIIQALFTKRPYPLPKNFSRRILKEIERRIDSGNISALHFNHLDAAQYVDWLEALDPRIKVVFDTHNVLTLLYERLFNSESNLLRKAYCWFQWRKMCHYEKAIMRKFDKVIVCSEVERDLVKLWGVKNCLVVPNGVDINYFTPGVANMRPQARPAHLVFTGAMDYLPNAEGVRWFLRSVFPELDRRLSSYKLTVVGKNPPADLLAYGEPGKVEFTGRVDDVRPYARSADVFIVPLRIGGGTRLKILEALAMELPVVSTRVGGEGLDLQDEIHLKLVDNASEMAEVIVELCDQRERARAMAQNGCEEIRKKYTWDVVAGSLSEFYYADCAQLS
jgi:glycosyltransferase involved in cell wall biosynthesis